MEDINHYELSEYVKFCKDAKRIFHDLEIRWDALLSILNNRIVIDLLHLESQLEYVYPSEYNRLSMEEIVVKHYGIKAVQFIKNAL